MYSIAISLAAALLVGAGGFLLGLWGWVGGVLVALPVFVVTWILVARRMLRRLRPAMEDVRRQAEAGRLDAASRALSDLLPLAPWIPGLRGQLHAQLGILAHHAGDRKQALHHLGRASRRVADAQLLRACIHHRNEETGEALEILRIAAAFDRKHALLHNTYAWFLHRQGKLDEAIAVLNRFLKKVPEHEITTDNLLRLQNRKRMNMKAFGMEWYALGLERPPSNMGQMRTPRKGFRTPRRSR